MTNKPMLSVERKLLVRLCNLNAVGWEDIEPEMKELRALLDKQSCGACGGCDNGCKLDRESPPIEASAQHQGEPVTIQAVAVTRDDEDEGLRLEWLLEGGIAEMEFAGMMLFALPEANDLCDEDGSAEIYLSPQQEKHNAPVSVVLPERREPDPSSPYLSDSDIEWNAAIDAVTRLNTPQ